MLGTEHKVTQDLNFLQSKQQDRVRRPETTETRNVLFQASLTCLSSPECQAPMVYLDCNNASVGDQGSECLRSCHTLDVECVSSLGATPTFIHHSKLQEEWGVDITEKSVILGFGLLLGVQRTSVSLLAVLGT